MLDDGWFVGRRSDNAGLGDWQVDPDLWPDGLHPLVDRVTELGMQFGLWVEPEMINLDSHLARAHPDWVMSTGDRMPISSRQQQVLDLGNPAAYEHILESLDALLSEYRISYLKWDHNRDLIDSGHAPAGHPAVHDQTVAVYALMDELRRRHPGLEIESCSSGGGRVDLEVLQHTDRVWTSDCIDALERQTIQRYTGLLLPPELIGVAHRIRPGAHHRPAARPVIPGRHRALRAHGHRGGPVEDVTRRAGGTRRVGGPAQAASAPAAHRECRPTRSCRPVADGARRHRRRPDARRWSAWPASGPPTAPPPAASSCPG